MNDPNDGPYSRYNARRSTPAQVARDFVPPDHYWELRETVQPQLVIGPRGIGKTTLLKMLLPEAIDAWDKREAADARRQIAYTGVFVAADKMWAGQFDQLAEPLHGDSLRIDARDAFARAAFAYMALAAFADAAAYRCRPDGDERQFRWVNLEVAESERLVGAVAPAWLAHPATATFRDLAEQMQSKLAALGELMEEAGSPGMRTQQMRKILRERVLRIKFFTAAVRFIDAFNRAVGQQEAPWVLLIDEFEFLPPAARGLLGESFQGHDPRLSYKISLAPYTGTAPFKGTPLDDWEKIELSPPQNPSEDPFTVKLFEDQLSSSRPDKMLKGKGFDREGKDSYGPTSRNAQDIGKLAAFDPNFRRWLERVLGGSTLAETAKNPKRRKELSKAMPLVRLRLEYQKLRAGAQGTRRSRHAVPVLYTGLRNIYAMSEGNPRWIKALSHALLEERPRDARTISPAAQTRAITEVAFKVYEKLKAVNIDTSSGGEVVSPYTEYPDLTPKRLLDTLGDYLKVQTHDRAFSPDVPGAFEKDVRDDEWLEEVLNSLVFLGAIVVEKRGRHAEHDTIRLARMWAPIFELLLRRGQPRSLKSALRHPRVRSPVKRSSPGQETLDVGGDNA
jgi:hypothetical protein